MFTRILGTTKEDIQQAAEIIASGGLVAFPTETVYGLGANALDAEAVGKVYEAKGRPSDNPMIVHIADKEELNNLTYEITPDMGKLMDAFWPGPLTIVVPAKPLVPKVTTGGLDTVAVRMPVNEIAAQLIRESHVPIAAPSANLSGKPSPTKYTHVVDDLNGRIDAIIAGDECYVGIESTVVDMTGDLPTVLRPGIITIEDLSKALGRQVGIDPTLLQRPDLIDNAGLKETGEDFKPKAPGMKYKHYAPKAEMIIFRGQRDKVTLAMSEEKNRRVQSGQKVETIIYDDNHPETAAHQFFDRLRACDKSDVDVILAAALSEQGIGFSVMNRMFKSAGYHIVEVKEMKIAVASDHGGYKLKEYIKSHLIDRGLEVEDLGTFSDESVDYPVYGKECGEAVASGKADLGVVCCGTGIGISIAANKVKGVRCGLCTSVEMAHLTKQHNNANMIALGGRTTSLELAVAIVDEWLDTEFEGGRHQRRVDMLDKM